MSSRKRSTTKSRAKPVKAIIVGNADESSTDSDLSDTDEELASFENMSRAPSLDEVALAKALWKTKSVFFLSFLLLLLVLLRVLIMVVHPQQS